MALDRDWFQQTGFGQMKYQFDESMREKTRLGFLVENKLPLYWEILLCTLDLEAAAIVYRVESVGGNFGVPEEPWFVDKANTAADDMQMPVWLFHINMYGYSQRPRRACFHVHIIKMYRRVLRSHKGVHMSALESVMHHMSIQSVDVKPMIAIFDGVEDCCFLKEEILVAYEEKYLWSIRLLNFLRNLLLRCRGRISNFNHSR